MSSEITLGGSLAYADSEGSSIELSLSDLLASVASKKFIWDKMSVTTSEVAIGLGSVSSLGYALFVNRDSTNYIELRVGTGSTKFATLYPGKFALLFLGAGITAPYAIANTAACQMEYIICSQ